MLGKNLMKEGEDPIGMANMWAFRKFPALKKQFATYKKMQRGSSFSGKQPPVATALISEFVSPFIYIRPAGEEEEEEEGVETFVTTGYFKRPKIAMPTVTTFLRQASDLTIFEYDSCLLLKNSTKSKNVVIYLVDEQKNELNQYCVHLPSKTHNINFKIGPGTTLASYVAYKKEYVITPDPLGDPRFPLGLGWKESFNAPALCLPLITPNSCTIYGVVELSKDILEDPYTKKDLEMGLYTTYWMSAAIEENIESILTMRECTLYDYLTHLITLNFCSTIQLNLFFSELVMAARIALCAQTSAFYTLSAVDDFNGIELDMYNETKRGRHLRKCWFPLKHSNTVAAAVVRTRSLKNLTRIEMLSSNYDMSIYNPIPCYNLLAVPIMYRSRIVGVLELVNKVNAEKFSQKDEEVVMNVIAFCEVTLTCCILKEDMNRNVSRIAIRNEIFLRVMKPCIHDLTTFKAMSLELPEDVKSSLYTVEESTTRLQLCCYARGMVEEILGSKYMLSVNVDQLLLSAALFTPDQKFHGFPHSFSMFHTVYLILKMYGNMMSVVEKEDLLFATLLHGIHKNQMLASHIDDYVPNQSEWEQYKTNLTIDYIVILYKINGVLSGRNFDTRLVMNRLQHIVISCFQKTYLLSAERLANRFLSLKFSWNLYSDRCKMYQCISVASSFNVFFKSFTKSAVGTLKLHEQMKRENLFETHPSLLYTEGPSQIDILDIGRRTYTLIKDVVLPWIYLLTLLFPQTEEYYVNAQKIMNSWKELETQNVDECWFPDLAQIYPTLEDRIVSLEVISLIKNKDQSRKEDSL